MVGSGSARLSSKLHGYQSPILKIQRFYFSGAIDMIGGFPVTTQSYMSNVSCTGSETSLFQCSHSINNYFCTSDSIAGVVCQGIAHLNLMIMIIEGPSLRVSNVTIHIYP